MNLKVKGHNGTSMNFEAAFELSIAFDFFPSNAHAICKIVKTNVCLIEIHNKHTSVLLLCLLGILMRQSLSLAIFA